MDSDAAAVCLSAHGLVAGYGSRDVVLDGVSLAAQRGRVTVILGPNGSGKSTVLRVLYGLLRPRSGTVEVNGVEITGLPARSRPSLGMGFLPQGRSLFPGLTVEENLDLGAWLKRDDRGYVELALSRVYERYPQVSDRRSTPAGLLSGGQQRMVELARLMMSDPEIVLIDEPSVGLSPRLTAEIYKELAGFRDEGRTVVLVDQNVEAAMRLADYVYVLMFGTNHEDGDRDRYIGDLDSLVRSWLRA